MRTRIKRQYKMCCFRGPLDIQSVTAKIGGVLPASYIAKIAVFGFLYGYIYILFGSIYRF